MILLLATILMLVFQITIGTLVASAGPPFLTDDPETVGYRGWEVYVASQTAKDKEEISGTAPHFEVNYGLLSNVDLHTILPLVYVDPKEGSTDYGLGDIELGVKYRFVEGSGPPPDGSDVSAGWVAHWQSQQGVGSRAREGIFPSLAPKELGTLDDLWRRWLLY